MTSAALAIQQAAQGLPATWEYFQQYRLEFLAAQHIQPGSWAERALIARFTGGVQAALGHPNVLAAFLVMGFFAAVGLVREKWSEVGTCEARVLAACLLVLAALCAVGVYLTQSRAGEAVLVVGVYWLAVAWWVRRRALRIALYLLPLAVAALGLAMAARSESPAVESALLSLRYRLDYWQSTWQMLRTDWLTGVGLENFGPRYVEFKLPQAPEEISDPHNFFLSVWSKLGLAGLAALVALGAVAIRRWRRPPGAALADRPPVAPLRGGEADGVTPGPACPGCRRGCAGGRPLLFAGSADGRRGPDGHGGRGYPGLGRGTLADGRGRAAARLGPHRVHRGPGSAASDGTDRDGCARTAHAVGDVGAGGRVARRVSESRIADSGLRINRQARLRWGC